MFDLDGTLVDSLRDLAESANQLLTDCGSAPLETDAIGRMVGDGAAMLVSRAFAAAGVAMPADALPRFLAIYNARLLKFTRPYPGIVETLEALSDRASLAVLTNKPLAATRAILEGLELVRFFRPDRVIGGDGPFPRKPDPSGLLHLCDAAVVAPAHATMVGDSVVDARTGLAAATRICLAGYGFGFEGFSASELGDHFCTVKTPAELLQVL